MMKASKHTETEGSRQQQQEKSQSLSIFITSFFTTTPLAINCSSIICHSTSSIPVEGEYRPSLKDCIIMSGSLLEALASISNKDELGTTVADFRPRPLALAEHGTRRAPVFREALAPHFLFSAGAAETRGGTSVRAGTTCLAMRHHTSTFKEKPNNTREQMQ
jgi:hypothetical protein